MTKKLYRSREHKVFGGVCGGIAEHFDIDPVLARFGFVLLTLAAHLWGGVLIYILMWIMIPLREGKMEPKQEKGAHDAETV